MSEEAWYYVDSGLRIGPISLQGLRETLVTLPDAKNVLVWGEGFPDWKIAGDVKELRARSLTPPPLPRTRLAAPMPAWQVRWWWYPVALFFLDRLETERVAKQWLGSRPSAKRLG
jgi:hypothetical protein